MTSFLDVIAADDSSHRLASRKAVVVAQHRVASQFGQFIAAYGERGLEYAADEIRGVVLAAAQEFGAENGDTIVESVMDYFKGLLNPAEPKTASVHESRKTKMCPFHKDVMDISLAQGEPKAGFEAMSQHWGGDRHCQGEGYKGDKCNFKPAMTTESYWEERKEKAEQRKQEREQAAELEVQQPVEEEISEAPEAEIEEPVAEAPVEDNVVEVDFGGSESAPEAEVPMSMAASVKEADGNTGLKGPEPTIDKRKWTPQTVKPIDTEGDDSPNPTKHKDVVEPIKVDNNSKPTEIGENTTERQDVAKDSNPTDGGGEGGTWTDGPKSAISSLIESDYDGFLPQAEVQKAVLAHRSR